MNIVQQEDLNFLLTNRIPRRLLTRFMGWFSRIEQPLVRDVSLLVWGFFTDLDLSDAQQTRFRSMHDCFTRALKAGARPVELDPAILVSPCDAIVGASGAVEDGQVLQVKGFAYALDDLLGDAGHAAVFRNGCYVTLRLTSSMYHRFHAPYDCRVESVAHFPGDTWNVNPVALRRVERLFCKNERAVIRTRLAAHRPCGDPGPGRRDIGGGHPAAVSGHVVPPASASAGGCLHATRRFAKARRWDGSSMVRPSSCSRQKVFGLR